MAEPEQRRYDPRDPSDAPAPACDGSPFPGHFLRGATVDDLLHGEITGTRRLALNRMGSFDWDLDEATFLLDEGAYGVMDLHPDEYDGDPFSLSVRVPHEEAMRLDSAVAGALHEGRDDYGAYFLLTCRDGTRRWAHAQGRVLRDGAGHARRVIGILRDATAELSHSPLTHSAEETRRRRTMLVERTTAALGEALTTRDIGEVLTDPENLRGLGADGLALGVIDGDRLRFVALTGGPFEEENGPGFVRLGSDLPLGHAVLSRRPRFVQSAEEFRRHYPKVARFLEPHVVGSAAFLPLVAQARRIGALGLYYKEPRSFSAEDRDLYGALAGVVAQSVQRARLFDEERDLATGLQGTMLPRRIPELSGGDVVVRYRAATTGRDVGGDWYDVIPLPQGRLGAVVGDVQGHDVHAAAVMGQLRIALRAYAAEGHAPATVLARASRFLADLDTERFATCTYVQVDLGSGLAHVVCAGHLGPLISDADRRAVWPIVRGGLPLGLATLFNEHDFPETRLHLGPGATLLLCTDGLVERPGRNIQEGMDALTEAVSRGPQVPEELADHLSELLWERANAEDDMALLLLRRSEARATTDPPRLRRHIHQADPEGLAEARAMVRHGLEAWSTGDIAEEIELIADELVTNALVHTDGGALLGLELLPGSPRRVRVEAQDRSSEWPQRRTPGLSATSGRGLLMVEKLADSWGVEPRGSGKAVWCEFRVPATAGAPSGDHGDGNGGPG